MVRGRPRLRSVRLIAPRNSPDRGSRRRHVCGRQHRGRRDRPGAGGSAGVGERGVQAMASVRGPPRPPDAASPPSWPRTSETSSSHARMPSPRTSGRSRRLHRRRGTRSAAMPMRPGPGECPPPREARPGDPRHRQAKETKRGGTGGDKSAFVESTAGVGEPAPRNPAAGSDGPDHGLSSGRADRWHGHRATRRLNASPAARLRFTFTVGLHSLTRMDPGSSCWGGAPLVCVTAVQLHRRVAFSGRRTLGGLAGAERRWFA